MATLNTTPHDPTTQDETETLRDDLLSALGLLHCIRMWLEGDLPEASAGQFITLINKETGRDQQGGAE